MVIDPPCLHDPLYNPPICLASLYNIITFKPIIGFHNKTNLTDCIIILKFCLHGNGKESLATVWKLRK